MDMVMGLVASLAVLFLVAWRMPTRSILWGAIAAAILVLLVVAAERAGVTAPGTGRGLPPVTAP